MEIAIYVGKKWADEERLAKRIARIIGPDDSGCRKQEHGYAYAWDLGGNEWWMTSIKDGVVKVAYRYGHGHKEMMLGLQLFLQWTVGKLLLYDGLEASVKHAEKLAKEISW